MAIRKYTSVLILMLLAFIFLAPVEVEDTTDTGMFSYVDKGAVKSDQSDSFLNKTISELAVAVLVTATKTDNLVVDNNSDTNVNPGDELSYTVVIQNAGSTAAENVVFDDTIDSNTTLVGGSFGISVTPIARNDSYASTGNIFITVPDGASDVLSNDNDPADGSLNGVTAVQGDAGNVGSATETTASGLGGVKGSVTMQANGSFTYEPPPGFTGTDTFTYSVTDDEGNTDDATVTITVSDMVWFVDNSSSGANRGTFSDPFTSISSFNSAQGASSPNPTDGDVIFIHKGSGNYTNGVNLRDSQVFLGQGVDLITELGNQGITLAPFSFTAATSSPPSGSGNRPLIINGSGNGINLATTNTLKGLNIGGTSGIGITGSSVGNLTIDETGINRSGKAFDVNGGGTLNVNLDEIIVNSSASGGFSLQNTGGTTTLSNVGITTTGGTGLLVNNGGTFTVTGTNNQISSNSGSALNLTNTTIGSSNVTFESVSSSGGTNGIVLNNTGNTGGFTITGDGATGAGVTANNDSGGVIQNTTGDGVSLSNISNISLNYIRIENAADHGIDGSSVNNLTITRANLVGNGNANQEHGLNLLNSSGNVIVNNTLGDGNFDAHLRVFNQTGNNLTLFSVDDGLFGNVTTGFFEDGISFETQTGVTSAISVTNNTFSNHDGDHVQASSNGTANMTVTITGNTMTGAVGNLGAGITINSAGNFSGTTTFDVSNNNIQKANDNSTSININIGTSTSAGQYTGTIDNNTIGTSGTADSAGDTGIAVEVNQNATMTVFIRGNTLREFDNLGIDVGAVDGTGTINATVTGNTATSTDSNVFAAMFVDSQTNNVACADIGGTGFENTLSASAGFTDVAFQTGGSGVINLESYSGAANSQSQIQSYIQGRNSGSPSVQLNVGGGNVQSVGACATPAKAIGKSKSAFSSENFADSDLMNIEQNSTQYGMHRDINHELTKVATFKNIDEKILLTTQNTPKYLASTESLVGGPQRHTDIHTNRNTKELSNAAFSGENINLSLGTLDPGQEVTIEFQVKIDDPFPSGTSQVSNQGTVSGTNFSNMLTDDPDVGGTSDPTVTPVFLEFSPDGNNILYVDQNVSGGGGSGDSWANAIPELRDAMSWAANEWDGSNAPLQIWVADGIYFPTGDGTDRVATFQLVNNVEIFGGFDGGESSLSARDIVANSTILSGDIGNDDDPFAPLENTDSDGGTRSETDHIVGDNSIHVVTSSGTDNSAELDGFTITGGLANIAEGVKENGAGIINDGGSPTFSNLRIEGNDASKFGGGLHNSNGSPNLTHITLLGNRASDGGGIFNSNSSTLRIRNAVMTKNASAVSGGAVYSEDSNLIFTNVTISENSSTDNGGGLFVDQTSFNLNNSILWNNVSSSSGNDMYNNSGSTTFNYSLYDDSIGAFGGNAISTNNSITGNPNFASTDLSNSDYLKLANNSPAIDAGDNSLYNRVGGDVATDLDLAGNPRVFQESSGGIIDMGAYELQGEQKVIEFTKVFNDPVSPGGTVKLQFTINNKPNESLSGISFTDDLDAVLSGLVATGLPKENICGTGSQLSGTSLLTFTGGTLASEAQCTFEVTLQVPAEAAVGDYQNTTSTLTATGSSSGAVVVDPASDGLLISKNIIFSKEFTEDPVAPGKATTLEFSIVNNPSDPLTDLSFTDDLDAVLSGLTATGLPLNDVCGAGSQLAGTSVLTFTGGNLPSEGSCTFDVTVQVPKDTPDGTYTNTTSQLDGTSNAIGGDRAAAQPATDDLTVESPPTPDVVTLVSPSDGATDVPLDPLFDWDAASGADTYELQVSENSDLSLPVIDEGGISDTEYQTISNLNFSTMHYWRVRGVNSGGDGTWSDPFEFTTLVRPGADDNRILIANSSSYPFTPADFGQTDNNFTVVIDDIPVGFNGALSFNGGSVSIGDKISVGDIGDGDMTYSPLPGSHGYGYDSFEFSIEDDEGNPSGESYTMTLDVAATGVELTGGEGWRFLGNPSEGDSFDDLLGPLWTKGIPGSDAPAEPLASIYNLDQLNYQWVAPTDLANSTSAGEAFIAYGYSDDNHDGIPEGFPKSLASGQNWLPLDGNFTYSGLGYNESAGNPDNYHLLANPHPVSLDFCEIIANGAQDVANNIDVWDPSANSGNGDYINMSCSIGDVFIAPFQSFWIRTTGDNPDIQVPEISYLSETTDGYFKQTEQPDDKFLIILNVTDEDQQFSNQTKIYFSTKGTDGLDPVDGLKKSPEGLATKYLSFYSKDESVHEYSLQNMSLQNFNENKQHRILLGIETTEPGQYILKTSLPQSHIFNGSYYLRDNQTDKVVELREGVSYKFMVHPDQALKSEQMKEEIPHPELALGQSMTEPRESRFELLIAQAGVDGMSELGAVPDEFVLSQNYPNPFNPTTQISYQLPVTAQVRLEIYDMTGRSIATLVNGQVAAGRHTVNFDASGLSSGVYLYRIQAGSTIITKKLTVVK